MPDYAEILRLYRKYRARPDEPLWVTFIMIAQQLERTEGRTAPTGWVCTGAYAPHHLRSGISSSEPIIQKILADNKKFGIDS